MSIRDRGGRGFGWLSMGRREPDPEYRLLMEEDRKIRQAAERGDEQADSLDNTGGKPEREILGYAVDPDGFQIVPDSVNEGLTSGSIDGDVGVGGSDDYDEEQFGFRRPPTQAELKKARELRNKKRR